MTGMKVFCRAGALALLFAASSASAQEGEAVKSLLGSIGIIPKDKEPIIYNERAPLVLPPKMDLPAPAPRNGAEANANWPKDPDLAARRKAAKEARTPYTESELYKLSEGKRLSIDEVRAGRDPNSRDALPQPPSGGWRTENSRMTPDELRSFSTDKKVELSGDGLERRYLSDPPQALLKAAGNAPLKASADPKPMGDPDSPMAFIEQQRRRQ